MAPPQKAGYKGRPITRKQNAAGTELECTMCNKMFPLDMFRAHSKSPTGKFYKCKPCDNKYRESLRKKKVQLEKQARARSRIRKQRRLDKVAGLVREKDEFGRYQCIKCSGWFEKSAFYANLNNAEFISEQCVQCSPKPDLVIPGISKKKLARQGDTKLCIVCGSNKPVIDFEVMATSKDGLHPYCKPCQEVMHA